MLLIREKRSPCSPFFQRRKRKAGGVHALPHVRTFLEREKERQPAAHLMNERGRQWTMPETKPKRCKSRPEQRSGGAGWLAPRGFAARSSSVVCQSTRLESLPSYWGFRHRCCDDT